MERNYFVEKFDQIKWTSEDQSSSSGQAKSYACTFCNRGFLNAQALGGHMNIHRRDRAGIKQQYYTEDKNQLSSDGVKNSTTAADPPGKSLSQLERKQGTNMIPRKPSYHSIIKSEGHETVVRSKGESGCLEDVQPQLQLPLFVEAPELASGSLEGDRNGWGGVEKLDLELRLGIEPPETNLRL